MLGNGQPLSTHNSWELLGSGRWRARMSQSREMSDGLATVDSNGHGRGRKQNEGWRAYPQFQKLREEKGGESDHRIVIDIHFVFNFCHDQIKMVACQVRSILTVKINFLREVELSLYPGVEDDGIQLQIL